MADILKEKETMFLPFIVFLILIIILANVGLWNFVLGAAAIFIILLVVSAFIPY